MSSAGATEEALFACLFPGQGRYGPDKAAQLAGRLREVADSLQAAAKQQQEPEAADVQRESKRRRKEQRRGQQGQQAHDLDFSRYQRRYVALELLYLGHRYGGFARQEDTEETIEGHLFSALRMTRLVPADATWQELKYSRGGRTDKGVSALGQVVALLLRSAGAAGAAQPAPDAELDYPSLLNKVLPQDIRVLGWADVQQEFSARFSAQYREYKYLIAYNPPAVPEAVPADAAAPNGNRGGGRDAQEAAAQQQTGEQHQQHQQQQARQAPVGAQLDLARMREAAAFFLGEHDFRNFCKVDVSQVQNFRRCIRDFRLDALPGCAWGGRQLLCLHIRGTAFLWHQVRCMAAVLLMVGRGDEAPDVVQRLLDVQRTPRKPQYNMASEEPLLLYSCTYEGLDLRRSQRNYDVVRGQLEEQLNSHMIRAGLLHLIQERLGQDATLAPAGGGGKRQRGAGAPGAGGRHVPLLLRAKEPAVEERLQKLAASRGPAEGTAAAAPAAAAATGQAASSMACDA